MQSFVAIFFVKSDKGTKTSQRSDSYMLKHLELARMGGEPGDEARVTTTQSKQRLQGAHYVISEQLQGLYVTCSHLLMLMTTGSWTIDVETTITPEYLQKLSHLQPPKFIKCNCGDYLTDVKCVL